MKLYFLVLVLIGCVFSLPVEPADQHGKDVHTIRTRRNAVKQSYLRWAEGKAYYQWHPDVSPDDKKLIISAMQNIENHSCVRFIEGSNAQKNFIKITTSTKIGCHADVGYFYTPGQRLNLNTYCKDKGSIIHELMHSLGFHHQQSTYDRSNYVEIHKENISPLEIDNFKEYSSAEVENLGEYDFDSIMHYGRYDGSKNGQPVMTALTNGAENMGQRTGLSFIDVLKLNKMYNC